MASKRFKKVFQDVYGRISHWQQNVEDPEEVVAWTAEFIVGLAERNGLGEIIGFEIERFFKHKESTNKEE